MNEKQKEKISFYKDIFKILISFLILMLGGGAIKFYYQDNNISITIILFTIMFFITIALAIGILKEINKLPDNQGES